MHDDARISPKYICPRTRARLRLDGSVLRAETGDAVYPMQAGMSRFLCFEPAEGAHTRTQLDQLNRLARENGWRSALRIVYGDNASIIRYVTEVGRASFIDLLPLTHGCDVLEIGPGLG